MKEKLIYIYLTTHNSNGQRTTQEAILRQHSASPFRPCFYRSASSFPSYDQTSTYLPARIPAAVYKSANQDPWPGFSHAVAIRLFLTCPGKASIPDLSFTLYCHARDASSRRHVDGSVEVLKIDCGKRADMHVPVRKVCEFCAGLDLESHVRTALRCLVESQGKEGGYSMAVDVVRGIFQLKDS